jgi:Na+/citrate or Na+/malate symporter
MRVVYNIMSKRKILVLYIVAIVVFSIIGVGMSTTVSADRYDFDEPTVRVCRSILF